MRTATVYVKGIPAAELTERETAWHTLMYELRYFPEYLAFKDGGAISVRLPKQKEPHESPYLFPFFESLLPEGEYARQICKEIQVDPRDRFGMLLALAGKDTLGDVTVRR